MDTNNSLYTVNYLWLSIFLFFPVLLSAQVSKSLNQNFKIEAAQSVSIQVKSPNLQVKYIQGTRILVETKVSISTDNSTLLDFIAQKGRYDLVQELDKDSKCLTLSPKKNHSLIIIEGEELQENVSYIIYIPEDIAFVGLGLANK